jgi:hypothetical protein
MKEIISFFKNRYVIAPLAFLLLSLPVHSLLAAVMQSGAYGIQSDSINFGGADSSSGSYKLNDSLGEIATGDSAGTLYAMHAGYWQMQGSSIALSSPSDLALTSIGGISGGASEGTVSWTVTTDNAAGYTMTIASSTSPALQSASDSFADYVPATADPDYVFTNLAANSSFGFSPEGVDVIARFKDNGSACNTGASETSARCWDGLSTTPKTIMGSTSSNQPSGTAATVRFRAEVGASHIQTAGAYSATITVTATTL